MFGLFGVPLSTRRAEKNGELQNVLSMFEGKERKISAEKITESDEKGANAKT